MFLAVSISRPECWVRRESWLQWWLQRHIFDKERRQWNETAFLLIGKVRGIFWRCILQCAVRISRILQQFLFNLQVALVVKNVFPIILEKNIQQRSEGNSKGLHSMTQLEEQARFIADGFLLCLIIQGTQWSKSRNSKLQSLQELKNLGKFFLSLEFGIQAYVYMHTHTHVFVIPFPCGRPRIWALGANLVLYLQSENGNSTKCDGNSLSATNP